MPRTGQVVTFEVPFVERTALMAARGVHRVDSTLDHGQDNRLAVEFDSEQPAFFDIFFIGYLSASGHHLTVRMVMILFTDLNSMLQRKIF
jgi:hypothetical protein